MPGKPKRIRGCYIYYFQNRFIIDYLKIIVKLIIVVDLQINQCKVSIHLLVFSLLINVQTQLKVRTFRLSTVNSTKVKSPLNFTMPNHVYSFVSSPNRKKLLIRVKSWLILVKVITFNQSKVSIIGKNLFNHMKVSNKIKVKSQLNLKILQLIWLHSCRFKIIIFYSIKKQMT